MDKRKQIRWISLFPQFGSATLGSFNATKCKPLCHYTSVFYWNSEQHLKQYWPDVPFYYLEQKSKFPIDKVSSLGSGLFRHDLNE